MQPDTSGRITLRSPLVALASFRISAPVRLYRIRRGGRPDLNSPMVETASVSLSNSLIVLLALTLLAALIHLALDSSSQCSPRCIRKGLTPIPIPSC